MTNATQIAMENDGGPENPKARRRIHLREISGEADSPLDSVGQDLRAARLRRGDEIAAVSRALKIRKDHLEALEEDRVEDLPGRTYALGFVRSYAQYLGLDANELAERYKHDMTGRSELVIAALNLAGFALILAVAVVVGWFKRAPWSGPAPKAEAMPQRVPAEAGLPAPTRVREAS